MFAWVSNDKKTMEIFATPRKRKPGWFNAHSEYRRLLQENNQSMTKIGNSIAAGLRKYQDAWRKHFSKTFNLGIGGYRVQHVLWRAGNIDLPNSTHIAILQCSSNNIDHKKPRTIAHRSMKVASELLQKSYHIKIMITGLLLGDNN